MPYTNTYQSPNTTWLYYKILSVQAIEGDCICMEVTRVNCAINMRYYCARIKVDNLYPATLYTINVTAINSKGMGMPAQESFHTKHVGKSLRLWGFHCLFSKSFVM